MAHIEFTRSAPCGFLIVKDGADSANEADTILVQMDWDYPSIASRMGWSLANVQVEPADWNLPDDEREPVPPPCDHDGTDGTIKCESCGLTPTAFIAAAIEHIRAHEGETFANLDDYFT